MKKHYLAIVPDDLLAAAQAHARALADGDSDTAAAFVDARAEQAYRAALARVSMLRPPVHFDIIARARLGFHFIVKVRFHGAGGDSATFQNRWRQEDGPKWRIVEIDDLGLQSPWTKPEKPMVNANA
jgi:hypothetical protein